MVAWAARHNVVMLGVIALEFAACWQAVGWKLAGGKQSMREAEVFARQNAEGGGVGGDI